MRIGKLNNFYVDRYCRHSKVTGSSFLYSIHWPNGENLRFVFDAGAKQGEKDIGFFNGIYPFNMAKTSFVIISHNHLDHIGLLPILVRQGFTGQIYTSYPNSELLSVALNDTTRIVEPELNTPIATIEEVEKTLNLVVGCAYKKIIKPHKNVHIIFYSNGHLVGAVLTLIVITCPGQDDITLIHTGDYKDRNIFFNVELPPKQTRALNISNIVCESTYGNVDSTDSKFNKCFYNNVSKALSDGLSVYCPTFAQGRHQEALYDIKTWKDKELIPRDTIIVVDGKSSQTYNFKYQYDDLGILPEMRNFAPKNIIRVPQNQDKYNVRREILSDSRPKIILSPSGMGNNGAAQYYLKHLIPRNDYLVHALGYSSPDSIVYRLLHTNDGDSVSFCGENLLKHCITKKTSEKSAHSPRDILLKLIESFPNTKSISINHGETLVKKVLREYFLERLHLQEEQILISDPDYGVRIESNGITDVFKTDFASIL